MVPGGVAVNIREIQAILPHGYPFLLLDRVLEFEKGVRAVGIKNLTINEAFFNGHYPGNPIMPGVLIIEALAQLAGIIMLHEVESDDLVPLFAGIEKARFKRQVIPGDVLRLEVEVTAKRSNYLKVIGKASVDGELAAEGILSFAVARMNG
ncbi:MAG: 3-hydroxyacyl-ACP dehydratase FabZ [Firmicutes bacterium]|nr:3-hydroxyacyl-ACP dehydratase FabZ [Bacillota bacterium]